MKTQVEHALRIMNRARSRVPTTLLGARREPKFRDETLNCSTPDVPPRSPASAARTWVGRARGHPKIPIVRSYRGTFGLGRCAIPRRVKHNLICPKGMKKPMTEYQKPQGYDSPSSSGSSIGQVDRHRPVAVLVAILVLLMVGMLAALDSDDTVDSPVANRAPPYTEEPACHLAPRKPTTAPEPAAPTTDPPMTCRTSRRLLPQQHQRRLRRPRPLPEPAE